MEKMTNQRPLDDRIENTDIPTSIIEEKLADDLEKNILKNYSDSLSMDLYMQAGEREVDICFCRKSMDIPDSQNDEEHIKCYEKELFGDNKISEAEQNTMVKQFIELLDTITNEHNATETLLCCFRPSKVYAYLLVCFLRFKFMQKNILSFRLNSMLIKKELERIVILSRVRFSQCSKIESPKISEMQASIYQKKNADYGNSFDQSMDEGGLQVSLIRMGDKIRRISSLRSQDAKVVDEKLEDTFIDLANYAMMTLLWINKREVYGKDWFF